MVARLLDRRTLLGQAGAVGMIELEVGGLKTVRQCLGQRSFHGFPRELNFLMHGHVCAMRNIHHGLGRYHKSFVMFPVACTHPYINNYMYCSYFIRLPCNLVLFTPLISPYMYFLKFTCIYVFIHICLESIQC